MLKFNNVHIVICNLFWIIKPHTTNHCGYLVIGLILAIIPISPAAKQLNWSIPGLSVRIKCFYTKVIYRQRLLKISFMHPEKMWAFWEIELFWNIRFLSWKRLLTLSALKTRYWKNPRFWKTLNLIWGAWSWFGVVAPYRKRWWKNILCVRSIQVEAVRRPTIEARGGGSKRHIFEHFSY